jgi:lysophospholipase L1-like esterase
MPRIRKQISAWLGAILAIFAAIAAHAADSTWIASWGSSPFEFINTLPAPPPGMIPPPTIVQGTVRYRLPLSQGGSRLTLRITNETGKKPLAVGAVTVGIAEAGVAARAGTLRKVTFSGQASLTIPAGAPALSDPVELAVGSAQAVIVSIFLPNAAEFPPGQRGLQAVSVGGRDVTGTAVLESATPMMGRTIVSAILVAGGPDARTIVAFGDSITDGAITDTQDVRGWPAHLALRLIQTGGSVHYAVSNQGISGNRVLSDGAGISALSRFDRDVLSLPNVSHIIVLEGINDIGTGPHIDSNVLIAGYRQLISRAHQHGITVIGGTLLPFQGAMYYSEDGERTRQAVNEWIRSSHEFDAVVDFDAALRDPAEPKKLAASYDSGDHLHPSDAGYKAMSVAIKPTVFPSVK